MTYLDLETDKIRFTEKSSFNNEHGRDLILDFSFGGTLDAPIDNIDGYNFLEWFVL